MIQSTIVGYSPALYLLLSMNSNDFKEHILKSGFIDPITWMEKQENGLIGSNQFLNSPDLSSFENTKDVEITSFDH